MTDIDDAAYKKLVEARIANNDGSTYFDVFAVTSVLVTASIIAGNFPFLLPLTVTGLRQGTGQASASGTVTQWIARTIAEALCLVIPMLAAITSPSTKDAVVAVVATSIVALLSFVGAKRMKTSRAEDGSQTQGEASSSSGVKYHYFFSRFRASLMLFTIACILAVDFTVFPNRFMKTELFGVSLMDTGVGCFVFSAAVALGGKQLTTVESSGFSRKWVGSSLPLLVLGGVRLVMVWGVDYHEHITEYGKHWNFFFTLASLPYIYVVLDVAARLFDKVFGGRVCRTWMIERPAVPAVAICCLYQLSLSPSYGNLTAFIDSADRSTLFAANKEGIMSSFGYISMYLIGMQVGRLLLAPSTSAGRGSAGSGNGKSNTLLVLGFGLLAWAATLASDSYVQACSRRMCNMTYVLFIAALSTTFLALFKVLGTAYPLASSDRRSLLDAVNRNQLPLFLVANLATGTVNLSMRTIFASPLTSYGVLCAYLSFILLVAAVWERLNWTLKAW